MGRFRAVLLAAVAASLPAKARGEDLAITELLAASRDGLRDEDGEASDWIEVSNLSASRVDLEGWHLTDDLLDLARWRFPPLVLEPGAFAVVFASGKDRAVAGRELHASFRLDEDGEYLARVRPDGVTVEHAYAPAFPRQRGEVSYGIARALEVAELVPPGAQARVLVPAGDEGLAWTLPGFDDAAWLAATTGVGYDADRVLRHLFLAGPAPVLGARCVRLEGCPDACGP
ncbi:MAG: lamin tail domain-containing protein [Planctomycetes bacterium]|nr:lamin tail domain-containing protein [Planctomycetota bacterium]